MQGEVTPYKGGGMIGSFGFVLEGNIEPGDYEKLKSVVGDKAHENCSSRRVFRGGPLLPDVT